MARNHVTTNLLMLLLLIGGLFVTATIKKEVFPEFELDRVSVSVSYPGASPEEVERGVVLAIEEAVRGLDGIKELSATAAEGGGQVSIELLPDANAQKVYTEIRQQVDRITTFPVDTEQPQVSLASHRHGVLTMQIYGDVSEMALRETVEQVRDRLLQDPGITQIDISGGRDFEILVEIPQAQLRRYGLTLEEVAERIASASVELPGGRLDTSGGDVLLRISDRREWADEFARIPIIAGANGSVVTLADLATVYEGFESSDRYASYNSQRSIGLEVMRVGDQTPLGVSEAVHAAMPEIGRDLPDGIDWEINRDRSDTYRQRRDLLLKNASYGLVLVLLLLGAFLELKLAFWVTMGIPISFLGGMLFLPSLDISINVVSMFAFIVALGIVVDDAIVVGENIYAYREQGDRPLHAAVIGTREVAIPVTFAILTNFAAFMPLYFIPGTMGKIWRAIPVVVVAVFVISWVESLLILPSHIAHTRLGARSRLTTRLHVQQQRFSAGVSRFIEQRYRPLLALCVRWRGMTVACGFAILILVLAYVMSGRIGRELFPRIESDRAVVSATLPIGSPLSKAKEAEKRLLDALSKVVAESGGEKLMSGVFSLTDENSVRITAYLTAPDVRPISTKELVSRWRSTTGSISGLETLRYESDRGGPGSGASLTVELSNRDIATLEQASETLAARLAEFPEVSDLDDGTSSGKPQLDFSLTPAGQSLGLTSRDVARQVRSAFSGSIALRQQRGRNEVSVRLQLPESERAHEYDIENLLIRTPAGRFVPLREIANVERGRAYTTITRRDARRTLNVSANVESPQQNSLIIDELNATILPELARDVPGLTYGFQGRQARLAESTSGLKYGFIGALLCIYFLLAVPFRSYVQPMVVMLAIPFGLVGATLGHILLGYNLSLMSMMGVVALAGVVVNDSLVLIDFANRLRLQGMSAREAIVAAGVRRFRPIILTTLTTFGGLAPMIFETSRQARFLIPMALSLGFGILFATVITLLLVPCFYLLIEDLRRYLPQLPDLEKEEHA
ncbi:MAG: AcrB/AcrD/AcrF family protein [Desulfuromonas sp.]|nr:MAG: AcrB/AcrD/AcrF family protein [Desulfuromonas sp.]